MKIMLALSLFTLLLASGCREDNVTLIAPSGPERGTIALSFADAPPGIVRVIAHLSRDGFSERLLSLAVADSGANASGTISELAPGMWHLRVDAFNQVGHLEYTGQVDVEIRGGKTAIVSLQLHPAGGTIEITVTWGTSCASPPPGLTSWWRAEESGEDAVGVNHGALISDVAFAPGKVGKAFSFANPGSFVRIPNSPSLNVRGSFSIEAWIYPTADTLAIIFSKWGIDYGWSGQRSYSLDLWTGRQIRFGIADSAHQIDSAYQVLATPEGAVALGEWNHVAAVYDVVIGKRLIYVNGLLVAQRTDPPIAILQSRADASIGAYLWTPNDIAYRFPGLIDEVSLYHRALTSREVASVYGAGSAGKCR